uniref:Peroxisomal membrane protein PEX14 n=1 Tax=Palpitomonas bilix TaxID=652834 RepID=A0A7S3DMP6_9EUKA
MGEEGKVEGKEEGKEGEGGEEMPAAAGSEAAVEEGQVDLIDSAVSFLLHEKVRSRSVEDRREFLKKKGLSDSEIKQAFKRAYNNGGEMPDAAAFSASSSSQLQPQPQPRSGWLSSLVRTGVAVLGLVGIGIAAAETYVEARVKKQTEKLEDDVEQLAEDVKNLRALVEELVKKQQDGEGRRGLPSRSPSPSPSPPPHSATSTSTSAERKGNGEGAPTLHQPSASEGEEGVVLPSSKFSPPPSPSQMPSFAAVSSAIAEGRDSDLNEGGPDPSPLGQLAGGGDAELSRYMDHKPAHPFGAKQPKPWERAGAALAKEKVAEGRKDRQ